MRFFSRRQVRIFAATLATAALAVAPAQSDGERSGFDWRELGQTTYQQNCSGCHGPTGTGTTGLFPPLAGHVPELLNAEGGRELVAKIVLFGMSGPIEVAGASYDGSMPAWKHLSDEAIAAVINHVATSWGNESALEAAPLTPEEIAEIRALDLTPSQVHAERTGQEASEPVGAPEAALNDQTGYYTVAQAERGAEAYREHCSSCHGTTMRGGLHAPALTNLGFFRNWGGRTIDSFYDLFSTRMPVNAPGSLRTQTYVDILAFWMSSHGYPSGSVELTADKDVLRTIVIERR